MLDYTQNDKPYVMMFNKNLKNRKRLEIFDNEMEVNEMVAINSADINSTTIFTYSVKSRVEVEEEEYDEENSV